MNDYVLCLDWDSNNVCMHEEDGKLVKSALRVKMDIIFSLSMFVNIARTAPCLLLCMMIACVIFLDE